MDQELEAHVGNVSFEEVQNLWRAYESARDEEVTNRPDMWTTLAMPTNLKQYNFMWGEKGDSPPANPGPKMPAGTGAG